MSSQQTATWRTLARSIMEQVFILNKNQRGRGNENEVLRLDKASNTTSQSSHQPLIAVIDWLLQSRELSTVGDRICAANPSSSCLTLQI